MRRFTSVLTAVVLVGAPLVTGVAHAAATDYFLDLIGTKSVTTSTGEALVLTVGIGEAVLNGNKTTGASVTFQRGGESHSWIFQLPNRDVTYDSTTGAATADIPSTDLGPFGSMNLTFTKSTSTFGCGGADQNESGRLAGSFAFDTGSAWGAFNSNHATFGNASVNVFDPSGSCGTPKVHCSNTLSWNIAPTDRPLLVFGARTGRAGSMSLLRTVQLASPAGATRYDSLAGPAPAPTLKNGVLRITTSGPFSGKARISGGASGSSWHHGCVKNGQKYTEHYMGVGDAVWKSPSGNLLTAHMAIFGAIRTPTSDTTATYEVDTYS